MMNPSLRAILLSAKPKTSISAAKFAIAQGAADVSILVIGDSTGVGVTRWPYLFSQWLAAQYPTHSVSYRAWNDVGGSYDAEVVQGTGTGPRTIRVWNGSVTGTRPMYLMGSKFAASVTATAPDLVIWNHGKNEAAIVSSGNSVVRGEYLEAMEQVRIALPNAAQAAIRQSPNRDDSTMDPVIAIQDAVALSYGDLPQADVYSLFVQQGKAAGLYADNVHPSDASGSPLFAQALETLWTHSRVAPFSANAAFLLTKGTNLMASSDFSAGTFTGTLPASWSNTNVTLAVETTIKDAGKTQCAKFTATLVSNVYNLLSAPNLAACIGKYVTLAVKQYVPAGQQASAGRIAIFYTDGANTTITSSPTGAMAVDGWRWQIISGVLIPATATAVRAYLYCDSAANAGGATVYYDHAVLVAQDIPRDL